MKFIELTDESGNPVVVRADAVLFAGVSGNGATRVALSHGSYVDCKESPNEVALTIVEAEKSPLLNGVFQSKMAAARN